MDDTKTNDKLTISEDGKPPETRIKDAATCYRICQKLKDDDFPKAKKRARVLKQYKRFPPTEYSTLVAEGRKEETNVNWGAQKLLIDSFKTSYVDLITERKTPATFKLKKGDITKRATWEDCISVAWGNALAKWRDYTTNSEQDVHDMLLLGAGVEIADAEEGWFTEHVKRHFVILPPETKLDLSNFTEMLILKKYSILELYNKVKNPEAAQTMGWNRKVVLEAIRKHTGQLDTMTPEEVATKVASGDISVTGGKDGSFVDVFVYYCAEFSGKVSKFIILRGGEEMAKEQESRVSETISKSGFLYKRLNFAESIKDVLFLIINDGSAVEIGEIQSLGEDVYVQCREDDDVKNRISTGVKVNMMLLLQGGDSQAEQKMREMVWKSYLVLPDGLNMSQQRLQLPLEESMLVNRWIMGDLRSSLGEMRVQEKAAGGEALTATQVNMDAAQSAQLKTTDIRRYAKSDEAWQRRMYELFCKSKGTSEAKKIYDEFEEELSSQDVPKEAWEPKNVMLYSSVLVGAGSPQFRIMAADKIIQLTGMTPLNDGQRLAIEDGVAAVAGRANVHRFIREPAKEVTPEQVRIGSENEDFGNPAANPQNIPVLSSDNHMEHVHGHLADIARIVPILEDAIKNGRKLPESMVVNLQAKSIMGGGHTEVHFRYLAADPRDEIQEAVAGLRRNVSEIQGALGKVFGEYFKLFPMSGGEQEENQELQMKMAKMKIELEGLQQRTQLKLGERAALAQQKLEERKEKASTDIAIQTAKTEAELRNLSKKAKE